MENFCQNFCHFTFLHFISLHFTSLHFTSLFTIDQKDKCINNSLRLARKYAKIFVREHYLFREANSCPRVQLEENCELRGTDNVQGQISLHVFAPNGGYRVYYLSNLFRNANRFGNWGIFNNYSMSPRWI